MLCVQKTVLYTSSDHGPYIQFGHEHLRSIQLIKHVIDVSDHESIFDGDFIERAING